ncbi:MAG: hypothetical protein ACXWC6_01330 [Ramlibacter sp.]
MNLSAWFLKLAVLYLIAGVGLGLFMAASHDHSMFPVHAHLNLLGWVSMGLFGLFYRAWPEAARSRLARVHFWVYVPAHFVQMVLLAALFRGNPGVEPALAVASVIVGAAIVCFAVVVWKHAEAPAATPRATVQPAGAAA